MPKKAIISKRKRTNSQRNRRRPNRKGRAAHNTQSVDVHRRLVLYPKTTGATWLDTLTWFSSIALQLFKLVSGVSDNLETVSQITSAGTVIILGPGDFATYSPFAVPVISTTTDKEVIALKTFPFERASLPRLRIRIVPSVDQSLRGGMYAAVLMKVDPVDSTLLLEDTSKAPELTTKYSSDYDTIIKHPNAILAPVGRPIQLVISGANNPHNIRSEWANNGLGYVNVYPSYVLCIGFSDLAASVTKEQPLIEGNYTPERALFEVHLVGSLKLFEPSELKLSHNSTKASQSCYTPKLLTSDSHSINVKFFDEIYPTTTGEVDLRKLDKESAHKILNTFDRADLIQKLELETGRLSLSAMAIEE